MNAKRKMIIAISAFAMVVLATVVAVIAVLAAQNVTIQSSINVTYTSSEVAAKVTAKYQVANGTASNIGTGGYEFEGTESGANATQNLTTSALTINTLTSTNNYVDFIFTFTNEGSAEYTATLTLPATATNFEISYTVPDKDGATKVSNTSFKIAGNTTTAVTYKVRYTIKDVSKNASISGTFSWNLA